MNPLFLLRRCGLLLVAFGLSFGVLAQPAKPVFQGQDIDTTEEVDTTTRPIVRQLRQVFSFEADGVFFSNDFDGARMNRIQRTAANRYTILIEPENAPINMSPWYAFQVWSHESADLEVELTYPGFARHRYVPKMSRDGKNWMPVERDRIVRGEIVGNNPVSARPKSITLRLSTSPEPLWISAQELQTSKHVFAWMDRIARASDSEIEVIGRSVEGRPIRVLKMGNRASKRMVLVLSRQHPPEVTGYLAMRAFVEAIAGESELAGRFRAAYAIDVAPLMNPDGVDNGHWRHNTGGIDLNRDWIHFRQPEGRALSEFMKAREEETGGVFLFGIDFHSTWDDIFYIRDRSLNASHWPNLVWDWLDGIQAAIPDYEPRYKAATNVFPTRSSTRYFYIAHQMEAVTYEVGDNTPREFVETKGRVAAVELMKLMLARD